MVVMLGSALNTRTFLSPVGLTRGRWLSVMVRGRWVSGLGSGAVDAGAWCVTHPTERQHSALGLSCTAVPLLRTESTKLRFITGPLPLVRAFASSCFRASTGSLHQNQRPSQNAPLAVVLGTPKVLGAGLPYN